MSGDTTTHASSTTTSSSRTGPAPKTKAEGRRLLWWAAALGYTGLLLFLLWSPSVPRPPLFPHDDKAVHLLGFAGIGGAWWLALLRTRAVWIVGLSLAVVTELGQAVLPYGRAADPLDALADAAGVALGLFVARRLFKREDSR